MRVFLSALALVLAQLQAGALEAPPPLFIEGYAGKRSVKQGEAIGLHVSTSAASFDVEVAKLGAQRRVLWSKKGLAGANHPVPDDAASMGCRWPLSLELPVGADWPQGYYEVTLSASDNGGRWVQRGRRTAQSSAWFVVRAAQPGKASTILLQLCTNTYNAYNNWGGSSVYAYNSLANNQGHRVSFERPSPSQFGRWELPFVTWAEQNGVSLDYAANEDLEFHPEILEAYRLVLSVGHDEYWSTPMRDNLEAFIGKGGNVAFFSGNTCCWQIRTEDEGRAFSCWKQNYHLDPVFQTRDYKLLSTAWSHHLLKRPENSLTGVGFLWGGYRKSHGQFMDDPAEYRVHRPQHWVFEGTSLKRDDVFGGAATIVGYECDGCELQWRDGLPYPTFEDGTPKTFEVLATCQVRWHPDDALWYERWPVDRVGAACMGVYTRGGTVFTAGTTDWAHGLAQGDKAVVRITQNILKRLNAAAQR